MRLFVAITPPDMTLDRIEALQSEVPSGRLVPRENLHLTLAFLGEVDARDAEALHDALSGLDARPFDLGLSGLEPFGRAGSEGLWLRAEGGPALDALHRSVRGAVHSAGIMADRQRFRPHITIARFGKGQGDAGVLARFLTVWGASKVPPFRVDAFSLQRSHLTRDGAQYEELARYPLGPADGIPTGA